MTDALRWCIAQALGLAALALAVLASLPAKAVTVELPLTDLQPQYASQLCWAAADAIAVNSFYATPCQTGNAAGRTSQAVEAGFNVLDVTTLATLATLQPANVSTVLSECETNIQVCNYAGNPILPGLTYKKTAGGAALSWAQAKAQIDAGHPFLFQWNYPASGGTSKPVGLHELVAIGYDDSAQQLIIWDPWPVPRTLPVAVPACDPANTNISSQLKTAHTDKIDFSAYVDPENEMGVAAAHSGDQYDLALPAAAVPDAPVLHIDAAQEPTPPTPKKKLQRYRQDSGVHFESALKHALPESLRPTMLKDPVSQTFGTPFPIIGLQLEDLRRLGSNPQALLTRTTTAVLFPVESKGVVVDAFLMLLRDGKWHRGGYANAEITRLLVQARNTYATKERLSPDRFYLVSVPGRAAFFAAHGRDNRAVLIPASSDPSINVVAEVPVPAVQAFKDLSAAIKRDDAFAAKRPSGHR
jgi:hypothetical protein